MDVIRIAGPCAGRAPVLLVMLPGAYSRPREFVDEGFVDALRRRRVAADVLVADAHLGYFERKSVVERLREDIVQPARALGYRQVWLVGISLGGFGALGYAAHHGAEINGVVALAPYLGRRELQQEIVADGGPRNWRARAHPRAADDLDREVWDWAAAGSASPPVYLGFGRDDRFAEAQRLFATLLPPERRFDTAGGHDWPPWRRLWEAWLDRGLLAADCEAVR